MELVKTKGYSMPVHTIPPNSWDKIICKGLIPKLLVMLSIDLDKNPERIAATEVMIKESANRISPEEIEKAFMYYIKGELAGLEPRDNYLTPILFSKVIKAYKEQKKPTPKIERRLPTEEEKEMLIYHGLVSCFDRWVQEKRVIPGYVWVYDHLQNDAKIMSFTKEEKWKAMGEAREELKKEGDPLDRSFAQKLEDKKAPAVQNRAKLILLGDYFKKIKDDGYHLKDLL